MKKKYRLLMLSTLFAILFASCEKEIDLEHLRPTPKLVLNSVAITENLLSASLSRTWFYTENNPNVAIGGATVNLYVNDQFVEKMTYKSMEELVREDEDMYSYYSYNSMGLYISSYIPMVNDRIRITAECEGYKSVEAEVYVPEAVPITDFKIRKVRVEEYGYEYIRDEVAVTFTDIPNESNYYLINFEYGVPYYKDSWNTGEWEYAGYYLWSSMQLDYSTDPLFTSHLTALDNIMGTDWISGHYGRVFNDDLISGKEYTIKLKSFYGYGSGPYYPSGGEEELEMLPDSVRVNLYSIPESYYRYMKSVIELNEGTIASDLAESGLAEPVRVYSNVKGGTGILGAGNPFSITAEIPAQ